MQWCFAFPGGGCGALLPTGYGKGGQSAYAAGTEACTVSGALGAGAGMNGDYGGKPVGRKKTELCKTTKEKLLKYYSTYANRLFCAHGQSLMAAGGLSEKKY